jgi:hypothetical protein
LSFLSLEVLVFVVVLGTRGGMGTLKYAVAASVAVLLCTVSLATFASYGSLVSDGGMNRESWLYLVAFVHAAALVPAALLSFFAVSSAFGAVFNWVMVAGFFWVMGTGMASVGNVLVYFIQRADLDAEVVTNSNIDVGLMMGLLTCVAASVALGAFLRRRRLLVTSEGLKVRQ